MDLDDKYGAYDKELAALKAQSADTLDRLRDHQSILAQHQTALDMLMGHGLDHNKRLSAVEKLLLRYDSLLQVHCTTTDESIAYLRADVNDTRAKLSQDLPELRR